MILHHPCTDGWIDKVSRGRGTMDHCSSRDPGPFWGLWATLGAGGVTKGHSCHRRGPQRTERSGSFFSRRCHHLLKRWPGTYLQTVHLEINIGKILNKSFSNPLISQEGKKTLGRINKCFWKSKCIGKIKVLLQVFRVRRDPRRWAWGSAHGAYPGI